MTTTYRDLVMELAEAARNEAAAEEARKKQAARELADRQVEVMRPLESIIREVDAADKNKLFPIRVSADELIMYVKGKSNAYGAWTADIKLSVVDADKGLMRLSVRRTQPNVRFEVTQIAAGTADDIRPALLLTLAQLLAGTWKFPEAE